MPAGLDVTVPVPSPLRDTESASISFTVSVVLPLVPPPSVAVIVVTPRATAVARPAASIVATAGSLLVQVRPVPFAFTAAVGESVVVPLPNCPELLCPQQRTAVSASSAHVCQPPTAMALGPAIPATCTGGDELAIEPSPTSPYVFWPQHRAVPSDKMAHVS